MKLNPMELRKLALDLQNVEEVARIKGVAATSVWYHLKRLGVTRLGAQLIQLTDAQVEIVLDQCNYDIDEAANRLNVHPSFVQGCINRLYINGLKER